jgi:M6 family metalloprotease-like protein
MRFSTAKIVLFLVLGSVLLPGPGSAAGVSGSRAIAPDVGRALPPRVQALLDHRTFPVRNDGSSEVQRRRLAGDKAPMGLNAILLMCDFSDSLMLGRHGMVPGDFPEPMQTEIYYAAHDSVYFDHLLQDVADYYQDVSGGVFNFDFTIHSRVVNLPEPMSFYGNHPTEGEQSMLMAATVVDSLDAEIDFSLYDTVILIHAGAGEETDILGNSPEQIYSTYLDPRDFEEAHADSLLDFPYLPTGDHPEGEGVNQVLVLPETEYQDAIQGFGGYFGSRGVYCFEVGLRLGMLSLSDFTPSGRPDSQGIGEFGLMGYGLFVGGGWIPPHPCAYNKYLMGWLAPREILAAEGGSLVLTPCENPAAPDAAIKVDITGQEYWLLTFRQQDPDGNRIFSLGEDCDLNGNNIPDFWDFDSDSLDGTPTGFFDPATDIRESLLGCEWDFFMSDNTARAPNVKGAGSGVYVWHIDEGVVQWAFDQSSNLFNSDPHRKSVDLEEADGIQDLDSKEPSAYQLGGDDDSFRGEDQDHFDPWTRPDTRSNGGAFTGVRFSNFSNVVRDSADFLSYIDYDFTPPDSVMGFVYADSITFDLSLVASETGGPELVARRDLPVGIDLRGSHLLTADLDGDGSEEIIAAGHAGEIIVLDGQLNEFLDHDGNPQTLDPFAVGTWNGEPVAWNLAPAVGNIDSDPAPEIVLTGPGGVYAFDIDGTPVRDLGGGSNGLYLELEQCSLPPVLVPVEPRNTWSPSEPAMICVVEVAGGESLVQLYHDAGDGVDSSLWNLGPVAAASQPVRGWDHLMVAVTDTVSLTGSLVLVPAWSAEGQEVKSLSLAQTPGRQPPLLGLVDFTDPEGSLRCAMVVGSDGRGETLVFDGEFAPSMDSIVWDPRLSPGSGLAPGGALVGDGLLGRAGHNGEWLEGWPVRPRVGIETALPECGSSPLVCNLSGTDLPLAQYLFPARDGRILARGTRGEKVEGWPLAGPAQSAGTPALGQVTGQPGLDLVAVGSFDRVRGLDDQGQQPVSETVSSFFVWSGVADAEAAWPMWGGSPWRDGFWNMEQWLAPPLAAEGEGIVAGSHFCYPSPLREGPLYVRASSRTGGRARAEIYDLAGELVQTSAWQGIAARDPFAIVMGLEGAVSGMYLCRLTVDAEGGGVYHSVISIAVVR